MSTEWNTTQPKPVQLPPEYERGDPSLNVKVIEYQVGRGKPEPTPEDLEAIDALLCAPYLGNEIDNCIDYLDRALRSMVGHCVNLLEGLHEGQIPSPNGFRGFDSAQRDLIVKAARLQGLIDATVTASYRIARQTKEKA